MARRNGVVVLVVLLCPALALFVDERRSDPIGRAKVGGKILDVARDSVRGQHHGHLVLRRVVVELTRVLVLALGCLADVLLEVPVVRPRAVRILRSQHEGHALVRGLLVLLLTGDLVQQHQQQGRVGLNVILELHRACMHLCECVGPGIVGSRMRPAPLGRLKAHERGGCAFGRFEVTFLAQGEVTVQQTHGTGRAIAILVSVEVAVRVGNDNAARQDPQPARPRGAERPPTVSLLGANDVVQMGADDLLIHAPDGVSREASGLHVAALGTSHGRRRPWELKARLGRHRRSPRVCAEVVDVAVKADGLVEADRGRRPHQQGQPRRRTIRYRGALPRAAQPQPRLAGGTVPCYANGNPALRGQRGHRHACHDLVWFGDLEATLPGQEARREPLAVELVGAQNQRVVFVLVEGEAGAVVGRGAQALTHLRHEHHEPGPLAVRPRALARAPHQHPHRAPLNRQIDAVEEHRRALGRRASLVAAEVGDLPAPCAPGFQRHVPTGREGVGRAPAGMQSLLERAVELHMGRQRRRSPESDHATGQEGKERNNKSSANPSHGVSPYDGVVFASAAMRSGGTIAPCCRRAARISAIGTSSKSASSRAARAAAAPAAWPMAMQLACMR